GQGGYDVVVACQLPKLIVRVRFTLPAPPYFSSLEPQSRAVERKEMRRRRIFIDVPERYLEYLSKKSRCNWHEGFLNQRLRSGGRSPSFVRPADIRFSQCEVHGVDRQ